MLFKENIKEHDPDWPLIPDHPNRTLTIWGSGSGKTNSLFNLINHQSDIDKIYLYTKHPYEAKYQFSIKNHEDVGTKHFNDSKAFIEYSNNVVDIYKNTEDYNPNKKRKRLIVFDDMIAAKPSNEKLNPIVTELFTREENYTFLRLLLQNLILLCQKIRLNCTHYFILKTPNKQEFKQITSQNLWNIDFQDFIKNILQKYNHR